MQKRFPATSSARTVNPRQCSQGSTPARFIPATCGPSNPSKTTTTANPNINACIETRKCFQRINAPRTGTRKRSNPRRPPAAGAARRFTAAFGRGCKFVRHFTAITTAGTRNAIDPGTHMMAPAAVWSASGERFVMRGAAA